MNERRANLLSWTRPCLLLSLALAATACSASPTPEPASFTATPTGLPLKSPTPFPTPTPMALPTRLPSLATVAAPEPSPHSTPPLPEEDRGIVDAILGARDTEHWVAHRISGSFTAPETREWLALVGNIGETDEMRWVIIGQQSDGTWRLRGTSQILGTGFPAPPPSYFPPQTVDFDGDGVQEAVSNTFRLHLGWVFAADVVYRWDGSSLVSVWSGTITWDNRMANPGDVPLPYREYYDATWDWVDLDDDGVDEIRIHEQITFYLPGEEGYVEEGAPSIGQESGERAFRWDGAFFRPYAPETSVPAFAYTAAGQLWTWQERMAHPTAVRSAQAFAWAPAGETLAWWNHPSPGDDTQEAILGFLDLASGIQTIYAPGDPVTAAEWTPDGRLAYTLSDNIPVLLDPQTGRRVSLPLASLGTWSPDGGQMALVQDGILYTYDLSTGIVRPLTVAGEKTSVLEAAWSPRGDWIACAFRLTDTTSAGVISPEPAAPLDPAELEGMSTGRENCTCQLAWAPDGARLAALMAGGEVEGPAILYLAETGPGTQSTTPLEWQKVLQTEPLSQTYELSWSPSGDTLTLAAGPEVWQVPVDTGEPSLRHRFSIPEPTWVTLEWAGDGSGFLAGLAPYDGAYEGGYQEHLYWFPADGAAPRMLLAGFDTAHVPWPAVEPSRAGAPLPAMVLAEYPGPDDVPLLHFIAEDGSETIVAAEGADQATEFQVTASGVYYWSHLATPGGTIAIPTPEASGDLLSTRATPSGDRLAWLFVDDQIDLRHGTGQADFRLLVTDGRGNDPRQVWQRVETPPDILWSKLLGWQTGGERIFLSQNPYMNSVATCDSNPGIMAVNVVTGATKLLGDQEDVADGAVSPNGTWLIQAHTGLGPSACLTVTLLALIEKAKIPIPGLEGALLAGDFSFAPDDEWVVWREWGPMPDGSVLVIRAKHLPEGEPFTVLAEASDDAPTTIGGWLGRDDLVLVRQGGAGASSRVTLPSTEVQQPFSPYAFLGVFP